MGGKSGLKKGDTVMIIAGGNDKKRPLKGKIGKILRFLGEACDLVVVEGQNIVTKTQKPTSIQKQGGRIQVEAPVHVSNVMYYAEKIKRPVRLKHRVLEDGKKVRGYIDPTKKQFVQLES